MSVIDGIASALVVLGVLFFVSGIVGLYRFPDVFCRLHAITKADNLGLGFVVVGVCMHVGCRLLLLKILAVYLLTLWASALNSYLLARNALLEQGEGGRAT